MNYFGEGGTQRGERYLCFCCGYESKIIQIGHRYTEWSIWLNIEG